MCQENQTKSLLVYHQIKPAGFLSVAILGTIPRAVAVSLPEMPEGTVQVPRQARQEAVPVGSQAVLRVQVFQRAFVVVVLLADAHSSRTTRLQPSKQRLI